MTTLPIAALFLPLFPLSVVLNAALIRLRSPLAGAALLLAWPQLGVLLLQMAPSTLPPYLVSWAILTSGFYAVRLLTVRDMVQWAGFLATSVLALTWAYAANGAESAELQAFAFWFSLPSALLVLLARPLARRFGAAYAGLHGGLDGLPRLAGVLVVTALAAVATPPFPGFFALLHLLHMLHWSGALAALAIWLIWGWAATRLLQGFLLGAAQPVVPADIGRASTLAYAGALGGFVILGFALTGGVL